MATAYLSLTGDDANDGSQPNPVATFARAIELAGDGGTINADPGTYNDRIVVNGLTLTIQGTNATLQPIGATRAERTLYATNGANVTISGFAFDNRYSQSDCVRWDTGSTVTITDCEIHHAYGDGTGGAGKDIHGIAVLMGSGGLIDNCHIHDIGDPTVASDQNHGVYIADTDGVEIRNCTIHDVTGSGIVYFDTQSTPKTGIVYDNNIQRCSKGLHLAAASVEAYDNDLLYNGINCMVSLNVKSASVQRNIMGYATGDAGLFLQKFTDDATSIDVQHNILIGNPTNVIATQPQQLQADVVTYAHNVLLDPVNSHEAIGDFADLWTPADNVKLDGDELWFYQVVTGLLLLTNWKAIEAAMRATEGTLAHFIQSYPGNPCQRDFWCGKIANDTLHAAFCSGWRGLPLAYMLRRLFQIAVDRELDETVADTLTAVLTVEAGEAGALLEVLPLTVTAVALYWGSPDTASEAFAAECAGNGARWYG